MEYQKFISEVKKRSDLKDEDQAVLATKATLSTLAEHLQEGSPQNLASQLPPEIAGFVAPDTTRRVTGEAFSLDTFYRRIGEIEGEDPTTAKQHAQAVLDVLCDAVTPGAIENVKAQLPKEYGDLLHAGGMTQRGG